jgi:hypothetical protein
MPIPRGGSDANPPISTSPQKLLGKRPHSEDNSLDHGGYEVNGGHGLRLYKKGRSEIAATNGVLEGGGSTSGTRCKPTTRALANTNDKSKAAGRVAEGLGARSAQGLYHRSSRGQVSSRT